MRKNFLEILNDFDDKTSFLEYINEEILISRPRTYISVIGLRFKYYNV